MAYEIECSTILELVMDDSFPSKQFQRTVKNVDICKQIVIFFIDFDMKTFVFKVKFVYFIRLKMFLPL